MTTSGDQGPVFQASLARNYAGGSEKVEVKFDWRTSPSYPSS